MSKEAVLIFLGILVFLVPFLGFPGAFEAVLLVIAGLIIAFLGMVLRWERKVRGSARRGESYVENSLPEESDEL